jgi:hypothetical protein
LSYFKTISIRRTTAEWKLLSAKVAEAGKEDLGQLLRIKIAEFISEYENNPGRTTKAKGRRTEKRPSVYTDQIDKLRKIGDKMDLSPSTIVDRFVIEPLLK